MLDPSASGHRTSNEDDVTLLGRLGQNDEAALAELYDRYGRMAFSLAYRIVGTSTEAEDVVQEAFLALWRQATRFDPKRGSARSYLLTIVHRRAVDLLRSRRGQKELALDVVEQQVASAPDPVDAAAQTEERELVRRALDELPADQREALELVYFGGLTVTELAGRQGIPLGTAKSRLRLALERMRTVLGETTR